MQNKQYQSTSQKVLLGSVGMDETFQLERTYTYSGIPIYTNPIKAHATPVAFDKNSFRLFEEAKALQPNPINLTYTDSLPDKPKFLNIEVVDKVGLIALLNAPENIDIKNYLLDQNNAHVVTNISLVLNEENTSKILEADELFVEEIGINSIGIKLYKDKVGTHSINFKDSVVFAYRSSKCCWKESDKYQLQIVDLVEGDNGCPSQSFANAKRAKKKINYFKF